MAMSEADRETLRVRWLGRVRYRDADALQHALFEGTGSYLLLLEHPHVFTLGVRAKAEHILVNPGAVGAECVDTDRGGDVTYHGPGQLVGYPIVDVATESRAIPQFVHALEDVLVEVLLTFGIHAYVDAEYPGVWVDPENPRKIAAIGVKINRGRSMHGFALNVAPDMSMFSHIVPCGIVGRDVTSMEREGVSVSIEDVAREIARVFAQRFGFQRALSFGVDQGIDAVVQPRPSSEPTIRIRPKGVDGLARNLNKRLAKAGVDTSSGLSIAERKPEWLRLHANMGSEYRSLKNLMREYSLTTVCEEAGCPNIFECWSDGTATFMINGEQCTRACGFCLVDTAKPMPIDPMEAVRVAEAVAEMHLSFAVITAVARDDLADGGAEAFARTIEEIRNLNPGTGIEVLIPDCKGDPDALGKIFAQRPDVLNHNIETPLRLQRAVRTSASYARSLAVLARAKSSGLVTKSGMIVGMGETMDEIRETIVDLRQVGVEILTVGQYLRPSVRHLPVMRYYTPAEFDEIGEFARKLGFAHVESRPTARSSYHAKSGAISAASAIVANQR
jgi:lipoic acid synthetase